MTPDNRPSFTCPDCQSVSHNPEDARNSYCGRCHAFKPETYVDPRCMEPVCPDFGSYDFGAGACPLQHAFFPAQQS